jgi:transglutaminase-like putative cysteine protease
MQRYSIIHKTNYSYDYEATESYSQLKISPLETLCQTVNFHSIKTSPDVPLFTHTDYFGNKVCEFSVPFRHNSLEIISHSEVTLFEPSSEALQSRMKIKDAIEYFKKNDLEFYDYLNPSTFIPITPTIREFAKHILDPERFLTEAIVDLNQMFTKEFKYRTGSTNINTPIDEVLQKRMGVCQDFAHTMIAALRSVGLAARYVSGYIESYDPNSKIELVGAEQSHAWVDVYIPNFFWFGLDPTNNMFSSSKHMRIGTGRDFNDVSPVRGTFKGSSNQALSVDVKMRRIETPKQENFQKPS